MQRILSEEEYQVLESKANKFEKARESIIQSIKNTTQNVYAINTNGVKVAAFPCTAYTFNMNLFDICKSLDIDIPKNISVSFEIK